MRTSFEDIKLAALALLLAIGFGVSGGPADAGSKETLIVAGGCFWCVEADFESVPGVTSAVSGYAGGTVANPSYKQVKKGKTGHLEAVKITFDTGRITRDEILNLFFRSVDPTDAGGQFCDRGKTYSTAIFTRNAAQKQAATKAKEDAMQALGRKIVTRVLPVTTFYPADKIHQNYYRGKKLVLTRFGAKRQSEAYARYRKACGRDARVKKLWGSQAAFAR